MPHDQGALKMHARRLMLATNKLWVRGHCAHAALLCLLVLLASGGAVAASASDAVKVYEWREANGVASYSQAPPPAGTPGVTSLEVDTRHFTPAQAAAIKSYLAGLDAAQIADAERYRQQVDAADQVVAAALQELTNAEAAFSQGRAPQPGDRVGNAGGGSRLRPEYFARQKALEHAVERARANLATAYRMRDQAAR
jgi:hypothetical protein